MTLTRSDIDASGTTEGSGGRRWRLRATPNTDGLRRPDGSVPWPTAFSALLAHRGVHTLEEARNYLGAPGDLTDPRLMPNLAVAVARLAQACRAGEQVAVFGDFDVDGITATTILSEGLTALGARPLPYIPDRFTEGYGPNVAAIASLHARGATVLVTADCGTSAVDEVAEANALGMDVLILDHHTVPAELPAALAIVNPKLLDSAYGSEPAAVGVSYKVIHDLYDQMDRDYAPESHRALVALGTICDLAPMIGENRDLVRLGLDALRASTRPGLRALCAIAGTKLEEISVDTCGWALGPRINAAGRMEHARLALDLLLATSDDEARALAERLDELNRQRREQTTEAVKIARTSLTPEDLAGPLLIVAAPDISMGIVGLAASRLADEYHLPAIAMQIVDGEGRASCRSIDEFDITALLRRNADLFLRFGGHRAAAGFSIDASRLEEVRERLIADAAERLDVTNLAPTIKVDTELPLSEVNRQTIQWLDLLGPHGIGNPTPTFLARGVTVAETRAVGAEGTHLQLTLKEGAVTWRAISFGNAEHLVPAGERADIVYTFKRDDFRGGGALQLEVLDLRAFTQDD